MSALPVVPPPRATPLRALVVDDDLLAAKLTARLCAKLGLDCETARDGVEALRRFEARPPNLVLADLVMPGLDGAGLLAEVHRRNHRVPVIIVTAHATVAAAVELLRHGATDLVEKPLAEETFLPRLAHVLETLRLREEVQALKARLQAAAGQAPLLGESRALGEVLARLPDIARSDAAVLVYGESGTGKELVARATHYMSPRADGPFITVNCGALPDELLESELFGHVRGAFTDARNDKPGLAAAAAGGSLFLDEIGEVSPRVQVKLLRFLQEKEIRPVGSNRTTTVDVRVIAATNRDLAAEVKAGRFREDLYYRLNILPVRLPPLRDRPEDIPELCVHFLRRFAAEHEKAVSGFSPLALQKLCGHTWPGNVRELENVIRRSVILTAHSVIEPDGVILDGQEGAAAPTPVAPTMREAKQRVIADFERAYLAALMATHHGNVSRAADAAGKDRKSFWELLRRYDLHAERFRRD